MLFFSSLAGRLMGGGVGGGHLARATRADGVHVCTRGVCILEACAQGRMTGPHVHTAIHVYVHAAVHAHTCVLRAYVHRAEHMSICAYVRVDGVVAPLLPRG